MSRRESEEDDAAPPPPILTTPTKASSNLNDGAGHAGSDAEGTENESEADVEKQLEESTGKKRAYHPFLEYIEVMQWKTGSDNRLIPCWSPHKLIMQFTLP